MDRQVLLKDPKRLRDPKEVLREILGPELGEQIVEAIETLIEKKVASARSDGRPTPLTPDSKVAQLFNVCIKTLTRWDDDPDLDFPPPIEINGRKYREVEAINAFIAERMKASVTSERVERGKERRLQSIDRNMHGRRGIKPNRSAKPDRAEVPATP
jgi:hypothetical protein